VPENGDLVSVVAPADFVVNTVSDDGDAAPGDGLCATADGACSLRAAVQEANQRGGSQRISLADWQVLLQGELLITDDLTISGLGAGETVIGGSGEARLLRVSRGAKLTLEALTLQAGATTGDGGALYNEGQAALTAVQISGSRADGSGGGIFNTGQVTITDSSITGNSAGQGPGGIANGGTLLLQGVTVSGNNGASGGIGGSGSATLESSTVSGNEATGSGGGFSGSAGAFELRNTIVAGNTAVNGGPDCSGGFTSRGYNLLGRASGCTIAQRQGSDISGQDARLESPELNDGRTLSAMPQGGSPAIDAGACDRPADQRGVGRPVDGDLDGRAACDIGAVEYLPLRLMMPVVMR
jgi:CSLREA domain-containing protein